MTSISHKCSHNIKRWRKKIERGFFRLGYHVAKKPWTTILVTWILVLLCSLGLFNFYDEKDLMELYVPKENKFYKDTAWLIKRYGIFEREQNVMMEADDVLTPEVLHRALDVHNELMDLHVIYQNGTKISFSDLCYRIPVISEFDLDEMEASDTCDVVHQSPKTFCGVLDMLPKGCMQDNILEIFKFSHKNIPDSKSEILEMINRAQVSPYSGATKDFRDFLGGVETTSNGSVVAASSLLMYYKTYGNYSDTQKETRREGLGTWASEKMLSWEKKFLEKMEEIHRNWNETGIKIYYQAYRSYGDLSSQVAFQEVHLYLYGSAIMFVYILLVLSKFDPVEARVLLGILGLTTVVMALIAGAGICSLFRIPYGPVHAALPFLLLGLGVDDMFVMMSCWRQLRSDLKDRPIHERMAIMLQTAGASITITSITDVIAFGGALVAMPILQSFCIFAAVSIFMMYLFVLTFFVAVFALDQQRVEQKRNGVIPCIVHKSVNTDAAVQISLSRRILKFTYENLILTNTGKTLVLLLTVALTAYNCLGLVKLRFRFNPMHHIPEDTYFSEYMHEISRLYPDLGSEASVLVGRINYTQDMPKLLELSHRLRDQSDIIQQVDAWPIDFEEFLRINHDGRNTTDLTDAEWKKFLYQFLNCHVGGKYNRYFKFEKPSRCGKPVSTVTVSQIAFKFKKLDEPDQFLPAKQHLMDLVRDADLSSGEGFSTVWGKRLMMWIPDEIVKAEILRNMVLALVGVTLCTACIILNFKVCFLIFVMVILTLVNVAGTMHHIGLILDMVTYIALQLSIGLCVDYAAHIGHMFLTIDHGTRNERALQTVLNIGEAVIQGGVSTFLALSVLSIAKTYSYRAFFQVNGLIILFGLFHGVVVLPVLLSLVGSADSPTREQEMTDVNNLSNKTSENDSSLNEDDSQDKMIKSRNNSIES